MPTKEQWSTLFSAIRSGDKAMVRDQVEAEPEFLTSGGMFGGPLHIAANKGNVEIAEMLIGLGCDVNLELKTVGGMEVPLGDAVSSDNPTIVRLLLEHGADANYGRHLIGAIIGEKRHSLEMVKLLYGFGADLHKVVANHQLQRPMNALSTAMDWGKQDVVDYLLAQGCVLPAGFRLDVVDDSAVTDVVRHFHKNYGPVRSQALIQIVPSSPPVNVHAIAPAPDRQCLTLFTSGLSQKAMRVPRGQNQYRFAELFIQLPPDWKYREISDPVWNWPIDWLVWLATYPHEHKTWLGGPVTIAAKTDPPTPIAPGLPFTSMLLLAQDAFERPPSSGWFSKPETVNLYRMMPLYPEERQLEIDQSAAALMKALDRAGTPFIFDPHRKNAVAG